MGSRNLGGSNGRGGLVTAAVAVILMVLEALVDGSIALNAMRVAGRVIRNQ